MAVAVSRGAVHEHGGLPLQDAAGSAFDPSGQWPVIVVADGHGNQRHFRSARGADRAVAVGLEVGGALALRVAQLTRADSVGRLIREQLVPCLVEAWRSAVDEDLAEDPIPLEEQYPGLDDEPRVAYGTTLLVAVVAHPWLVACQIGDGEVMVVDSSGTAELPVPGDPRLDGEHTTSMCQPDAEDSFRWAVVDLRTTPLSIVLLASDGFSNAQSSHSWHPRFGADLLRMVAEHGIEWIREQLPVWVSQCASGDGSGDDTSVALLLRTDRR